MFEFTPVRIMVCQYVHNVGKSHKHTEYKCPTWKSGCCLFHLHKGEREADPAVQPYTLALVPGRWHFFMLLLFRFLIWVLITWECSVCENESSWILMMCSLSVYVTFQQMLCTLKEIAAPPVTGVCSGQPAPSHARLVTLPFLAVGSAWPPPPARPQPVLGWAGLT